MALQNEKQTVATRREFLGTLAAVAAMAGVGGYGRGFAADAAAISSEPLIAHGDGPEPAFHGPRIVGGTPGKPFLFKVPFTGQGRIKLSADHLPTGLQMSEEGIITGSVPSAGEYHVQLAAMNSHGKAARILKIVAGAQQLALTPALGWNSWNAYDINNEEALTRSSANAMVSSGLAAKGFMYINIDDGWQNGRTTSGEIKTTAKFGNMAQLADYIHSKGLRFGVYSSPGRTTCGGHTGSYGHEMQDARTYAGWGVDYLKYDWCSYSNIVKGRFDQERFIKPYALMGKALQESGRDIFFSLCQYGMGHVWTWAGGAPVYGNSYRISGDINDSWGAMCGNGFGRDGDLFPFAAPGHWNDPDMLVVGTGHFEDGGMHPTKLTQHEQITHITLWCMLAAPLLLGCDLTKLDRFTIDLMANTEVLAVNQDELGHQAQRIWSRGLQEIWAKPLWDGSCAVAFFNRGPSTANMEANWSMLDPVLVNSYAPLRGKQPIRNLWQRQDMGVSDGYSVAVASHGAVMIKVGRKA